MFKRDKRKIGVFIDGANLWHCQKNNGWKIDFHKLKWFFYQRGDVKDIYYFTPELPYLGKLFKTLDAMGYKIVKKPIKVLRGKNKDGIYEVKHKGNLDIEMAITIIKSIDKYDEIILVTGDSDFECVLDELKSSGKNIVCLCNSDSLAHELRKKSNQVFILNQLKKKLKYKKQPPV